MDADPESTDPNGRCGYTCTEYIGAAMKMRENSWMVCIVWFKRINYNHRPSQSYLVESRQQPCGRGDANQVLDLRCVSLPRGLYYPCPKKGHLLSIFFVAIRPHFYQQTTKTSEGCRDLFECLLRESEADGWYEYKHDQRGPVP